jgi:hypothetical protein
MTTASVVLLDENERLDRIAADTFSIADQPANTGPLLQETGQRDRQQEALRVSDTPGGTGPELYLLLAEHEAGRLEPDDVKLGELPRDATRDMRAVAAEVRLLMGLRWAVGDRRPLPLAAKFVARRQGWRSNHHRARRAIRALCDAGMIEYAGSLAPRGKRDGTKTYAPLPAASAGAVEGESVAVEPVAAIEPETKPRKQAGVRGAEPTQRLDVSVTTRDSAGTHHDAPDASEPCGYDGARPPDDYLEALDHSGVGFVLHLADADPGAEVAEPELVVR